VVFTTMSFCLLDAVGGSSHLHRNFEILDKASRDLSYPLPASPTATAFKIITILKREGIQWFEMRSA
jgi:hypothetical protein